MNLRKEWIESDLYRYCGDTARRSFRKAYRDIPGFRFMYWFRCASYYRSAKAGIAGSLWNKVAYLFCRTMYGRYRFRYGIDIPVGMQIGKGFYIGHFSGIVVVGNAVIGKNVNISQGVTIGRVNRGEREGVPVIGDRVYIGPGAKIIGKVRIGNDVAIGANAVVTKDVPDHSVVAGVPARVISQGGTEGYINHTVE